MELSNLHHFDVPSHSSYEDDENSINSNDSQKKKGTIYPGYVSISPNILLALIIVLIVTIVLSFVMVSGITKELNSTLFYSLPTLQVGYASANITNTIPTLVQPIQITGLALDPDDPRYSIEQYVLYTNNVNNNNTITNHNQIYRHYSPKQSSSSSSRLSSSSSPYQHQWSRSSSESYNSIPSSYDYINTYDKIPLYILDIDKPSNYRQQQEDRYEEIQANCTLTYNNNSNNNNTPSSQSSSSSSSSSFSSLPQYGLSHTLTLDSLPVFTFANQYRYVTLYHCNSLICSDALSIVVDVNISSTFPLLFPIDIAKIHIEKQLPYIKHLPRRFVHSSIPFQRLSPSSSPSSSSARHTAQNASTSSTPHKPQSSTHDKPSSSFHNTNISESYKHPSSPLRLATDDDYPSSPSSSSSFSPSSSSSSQNSHKSNNNTNGDDSTIIPYNNPFITTQAIVTYDMKPLVLVNMIEGPLLLISCRNASCLQDSTAHKINKNVYNINIKGGMVRDQAFDLVILSYDALYMSASITLDTDGIPVIIYSSIHNYRIYTIHCYDQSCSQYYKYYIPSLRYLPFSLMKISSDIQGHMHVITRGIYIPSILTSYNVFINEYIDDILAKMIYISIIIPYYKDNNNIVIDNNNNTNVYHIYNNNNNDNIIYANNNNNDIYPNISSSPLSSSSLPSSASTSPISPISIDEEPFFIDPTADLSSVTLLKRLKTVYLDYLSRNNYHITDCWPLDDGDDDIDSLLLNEPRMDQFASPDAYVCFVGLATVSRRIHVILVQARGISLDVYEDIIRHLPPSPSSSSASQQSKNNLEQQQGQQQGQQVQQQQQDQARINNIILLSPPQLITFFIHFNRITPLLPTPHNPLIQIPYYTISLPFIHQCPYISYGITDIVMTSREIYSYDFILVMDDPTALLPSTSQDNNDSNNNDDDIIITKDILCQIPSQELPVWGQYDSTSPTYPFPNLRKRMLVYMHCNNIYCNDNILYPYITKSSSSSSSYTHQSNINQNTSIILNDIVSFNILIKSLYDTMYISLSNTRYQTSYHTFHINSGPFIVDGQCVDSVCSTVSRSPLLDISRVRTIYDKITTIFQNVHNNNNNNNTNNNTNNNNNNNNNDNNTIQGHNEDSIRNIVQRQGFSHLVQQEEVSSPQNDYDISFMSNVLDQSDKMSEYTILPSSSSLLESSLLPFVSENGTQNDGNIYQCIGCCLPPCSVTIFSPLDRLILYIKGNMDVTITHCSNLTCIPYYKQ